MVRIFYGFMYLHSKDRFTDSTQELWHFDDYNFHKITPLFLLFFETETDAERYDDNGFHARNQMDWE